MNAAVAASPVAAIAAGRWRGAASEECGPPAARSRARAAPLPAARRAGPPARSAPQNPAPHAPPSVGAAGGRRTLAPRIARSSRVRRGRAPISPLLPPLAAMRRSRAFVAVLLLLVAAGATAQDASPEAAEDTCVLPLDVDAAPARAGGVVSSTTGPTGPVVVAGKLALSGRLALELRGACPTDAAALRAALPGARLVAGSELRLDPTTVKAKVRVEGGGRGATPAPRRARPPPPVPPPPCSGRLPRRRPGRRPDQRHLRPDVRAHAGGAFGGLGPRVVRGLLVAATPGGAVVAGGKPVTLSSKGPANSAATFDFSRGTVRGWACMRAGRPARGWGGPPGRPRPPPRA